MKTYASCDPAGSRRSLSACLAILFLCSLLAVPAFAADTPDTQFVTVAGSLQQELGCAGDWQPDCADTHLAFDAEDGVWQGTFNVPAGSWEYKAPLNNSWDENYGLNAARNGANIPLSLSSDASVKFYYSHPPAAERLARMPVAA